MIIILRISSSQLTHRLEFRGRLAAAHVRPGRPVGIQCPRRQQIVHVRVSDVSQGSGPADQLSEQPQRRLLPVFQPTVTAVRSAIRAVPTTTASAVAPAAAAAAAATVPSGSAAIVSTRTATAAAAAVPEPAR